MAYDFLIQTDGGARGNPGPAALGYVVYDRKGVEVISEGRYLGEKTNNEAEYQAAVSALEALKGKIGKSTAKKSSVELRADSELMVKQMNGEYKISNERIQPLFLRLWNMAVDFREVRFVAVPREENKRADGLVNEALDAKGSSRSLFG